MTPAMQIALSATPLAAYFYYLGVLHGGKRPRLVSGPVDVALLAVGLGGLVAFGPFGKATLGRILNEQAGLLGWAVWVTMVTLWAMVLTGTATLRLAIYHVSPEELVKAIRDALAGLEGRFAPTLKGFEDVERGSGLTVRVSRILRSGSVEAYGLGADVLIRELKPRLRETLARYPQRASGVSRAMFLVACLTMVIPVSGYLVVNPKAGAAVRALMHSLRWW